MGSATGPAIAGSASSIWDSGRRNASKENGVRTPLRFPLSHAMKAHGIGRTALEGRQREPAAAANRRAPALVRRGRPAGDRVLRLSRSRLPASVRHMPGVHRAFGVAQRLPAHSLSGPASPRQRARHLAAGLRHPPALRAALSDRRHREPLHVPARRARHRIRGHAAAAQHHRARSPGCCRHRAAGVPPPAPAVVPGTSSSICLRSIRRACWARCCPA